MSIKTYSVKADGNKNLSKNFKAREFACKDEAHEIKIDSRLVELLQKNVTEEILYFGLQPSR